jgi:hypothetical protein
MKRSQKITYTHGRDNLALGFAAKIHLFQDEINLTGSHRPRLAGLLALVHASAIEWVKQIDAEHRIEVGRWRFFAAVGWVIAIASHVAGWLR